MQDGCIRVLTEVRYIPQVKRNLISLGLLERKGCVFSSAGGKMVVSKNSKIVMQAERIASLYYLLAEVQVSEGLELWLKRLGHPAERSIRELVKSGVMKGQLEVEHLRCEECMLGKSKKLTYSKGKHTLAKPLD
ncbi:uncharacterized mitochondrial protein AtMg00300-like [Salvia splendens]|uniref:uncharacterized mitochondrial protein AtMg00300-like n=1 Tax=Salvia splendens TaxID=180675 RepID=UPI001C27CD86|nr:uncharacterized mitochondrial protein AtMg00300-like [Salvia splendens]